MFIRVYSCDFVVHVFRLDGGAGWSPPLPLSPSPLDGGAGWSPPLSLSLSVSSFPWGV